MHAPSHLRDDLLGRIERSVSEGGSAFAGGGGLVGQLSDCTDIMPRDACAALDLPQGSSFAHGVRHLKPDLERRGV